MAEATMPERAKLIEAAMRSGQPAAFLMGMQSAFRLAGRLEDFSTAGMLRELVEQGEIERLLYFRRKWQQVPIGRNFIK